MGRLSRYVVLDGEKLKAIHWVNETSQTFIVSVLKRAPWWRRLFGTKALIAEIRVNFNCEWRFNGNTHQYPYLNLHFMHNGEKIAEPAVDCDLIAAIREAWQEAHKYIQPDPWSPVRVTLPQMKLLKR